VKEKADLKESEEGRGIMEKWNEKITREDASMNFRLKHVPLVTSYQYIIILNVKQELPSETFSICSYLVDLEPLYGMNCANRDLLRSTFWSCRNCSVRSRGRRSK
jgi:hypothetical protein